jgi:hypothetical protein
LRENLMRDGLKVPNRGGFGKGRRRSFAPQEFHEIYSRVRRQGSLILQDNFFATSSGVPAARGKLSWGLNLAAARTWDELFSRRAEAKPNFPQLRPVQNPPFRLRNGCPDPRSL